MRGLYYYCCKGLISAYIGWKARTSLISSNNNDILINLRGPPSYSHIVCIIIFSIAIFAMAQVFEINLEILVPRRF